MHDQETVLDGQILLLSQMGPCFNNRAAWTLHQPNVAKGVFSFCMVDDIRIAAPSAKMGVLSISDDLQIALSKRTMGGQENRGGEGQVCCRLLSDAGL